jgi:hypothetical protein
MMIMQQWISYYFTVIDKPLIWKVMIDYWLILRAPLS